MINSVCWHWLVVKSNGTIDKTRKKEIMTPYTPRYKNVFLYPKWGENGILVLNNLINRAYYDAYSSYTSPRTLSPLLIVIVRDWHYSYARFKEKCFRKMYENRFRHPAKYFKYSCKWDRDAFGRLSRSWISN